MIKIESVEGVCTVDRDGHKCVLFVGMIITPEEVTTINANGDVVYTIDETTVVVVPKGTKATISVVEEGPVEAPAEAPVEPAPVEAPVEAAPVAEVVPAPVETPVEATAKK